MKTKAILFILVTLCTLSTVSYGQKATPWVINDVPPNEINNRFLNDVISGLNRPALSIVGFDNSNDHSKGYGLKQVLNHTYSSPVNEEQKDLFERILIIANQSIEFNPTDREHYQANSNILQYRAFEALASYVLEQNGVNPNSFGIPMRSQSNLHQF
jgi:hypothetical protein